MDAPSVVRSERLDRAGFAHGFSTRAGGTSAGPYGTLNLGRGVGDEPAHVAANHAVLARTIGYDPAQLFETSQVHGAAVVTVHGQESPGEVRTRAADAVIARHPGCAVGVRTADCVPVLLAAPGTGAVAAVHAGWRGIVAGVVPAAVHALEPAAPETLIAAVGPAIGPCCFEVGPDVATALAQAAGDGIVLRRGDAKPHVDLWRAVAHQLRRAGVTQVDALDTCTVCNPALFFSYRRDGRVSGRMLSAIVARAKGFIPAPSRP